jgi:two-component system NarL family sensor kinase
MQAAPNALWSLFLAAVVTITVVVVALGTAMVIAQRRRLALQDDYARRLSQAHEDERAYIARELHDDALQRVALIRNELEHIWTPLSLAARPEESKRLRAVNAELVDLGVTLRAVAERLHPTIVEQLGLPRALQALGDEFRRKGLEVDMQLCQNDLALAPPVAHAAYRITQEALRNVQRHAGTTSARVDLEAGGQGVVLRVTDRGKGFEPGQRNGNKRGLGLHGMRERAQQAGGALTLLSRPGEGTTVEAVLPREWR